MARLTKLLLAVTLALPRQAQGIGTFVECAQPGDGLVFTDIHITPKIPRTNCNLQVRVPGYVGSEAADANSITVTAEVNFCRRFQDCMTIFQHEAKLSKFINCSTSTRCMLRAGQAFEAVSSWQLPLEMVRGTYSLTLRTAGKGPEHAGCYMLTSVEVLASRWFNKLRDKRDALMAFGIAASSSRALGSLFPSWSGGLLPQITGFLFMGILVGPFVTNLVSHMHVFLIGDVINQVSLAFIAGAAGSEIFVPELQRLLLPMCLQVFFICGTTMVLCSVGLFVAVGCGLVEAPAISLQPNLLAQCAVSLLAAALMTARSPASAIAVIAELQCGEKQAAKMAIGITVLSDVAVLILFSVCSQLVKATIDEGGGKGSAMVLLDVVSELGASAILGIAAGQLLRLVLPPSENEKILALELENDGAVELDMESKIPDEKEEDALTRLLKWGGMSGFPSYSTFSLFVRGFLVLGILHTAFVMAASAGDWTEDRIRLEPLMACTVASCVCGHDKARRAHLLEALSLWTPIVLLPFFTLAGASLQLPLILDVLPAALVLVVLRALGIAIGSMGAGRISARVFPSASMTPVAVRWTWLTLLAQAGVTLGLVLEVQRKFPDWGKRFGTLIIGVVIINQLVGPVLCRLGLQWMVPAEPENLRKGSDNEGGGGGATTDWQSIFACCPGMPGLSPLAGRSPTRSSDASSCSSGSCSE